MESTVPTEGLSQDSEVDDIGRPIDGRGAGEIELERGSQVGRYVVLRPLGRGGMGVVYVAYDPELDRKVALKLIHTRGRDSKRQAAARARLMREAQSLARLSHPSVVTVLDVGTYEERVFVAMEFVDGWTFGAWLKQGKRGWREILTVLRDAGRGLEAAHMAGLVHRDFKPENVMIRRDGRVVVLDFGLARQANGDDSSASGVRATLEPEETVDDVVSGARGEGSLEVSLTRTGGVMGTPAYMAPEQHLGLPTDARSDQFSFCVTLYEALYGERPFGNGRPATLAFNISHGRIRPAPREARVPKWVRRVLLRGLQADPEDRFASMADLIQALSRDPARVRWVSGLAAAAVLAGSVGAYGLAIQPDNSDAVCRGGERRLATVWGETRKAEIRSAFTATKKSFAADVAGRVIAGLDDYTRRWLAGYTAACEATALHQEQSTGMLDLRMACLDRDLKQLGAVTEALTEMDGERLTKAMDAVGELPDLAHCADLEALQVGAKVPRPQDQNQVERFERLYARAKALRDLGAHKEAAEAVSDVVAAAERLNHPPSTARALLLAATIEESDHRWEEMDGTLRGAVNAADKAHDDASRAEAMMTLARFSATRNPTATEADQWANAAAAVVERAGSPLRLRATLERSRGWIARERGNMKTAEQHYASALAMYEIETKSDDVILVQLLLELANVVMRSGDLERARTHAVRALELQESYYGSDHPQLAKSVNLLATIDLQAGQLEAGLAGFRRGHKLAQERFGNGHPEVAGLLNNVGVALQRLRRMEESIEVLEESLKIMENHLGPNDLELVPRLENLGNSYMYLREWDKSRKYLERCLQIKQGALGDDHPDLGTTWANLGRYYFLTGDYAQGERFYRRTLALWREKLEPSNLQFVQLFLMMGELALERGRHDEALQHFGEALELAREAVGETHPFFGVALAGVGSSEAHVDRDEGVAKLERALKIQEANALGDAEVAQTQFALAKHLIHSDRRRAMKLAREARAALHQTLPRSRELEKVEHWLAEHTRGAPRPPR